MFEFLGEILQGLQESWKEPCLYGLEFLDDGFVAQIRTIRRSEFVPELS
ncbi:hypothetical protein Salmuc_03401 [Salipiger mucosus DSM 16094]|uniref:Uncharacterized protein n=1 Tax=Salipiger mucosus DSM 16094 TaxID=1123237 RepID=S9RVS3_9RHOB|nr:hypothetical protein Salmuc_03401 [Salipiger mucosus DSM 16094]